MPPIVHDVQKIGFKGENVKFDDSIFIKNYEDRENDELTKIKITKLPSNGILKLLDTPISLN